MDNHLSRKFEEIVGKDNVLASEADRHAYSYDAAVLPPKLPALAVRPETPEALGRVVATCNELGLPLTVRGSGTNLSGGTIPSTGGVVALTGALNKIIEINEADMYAVVQTPSGGFSTRPIPAARPCPPSAATWPRTPAGFAASNTA